MAPPPLRRSTGTACLTARNIDLTRSAIAASQPASLTCSAPPCSYGATALLTRMSSRLQATTARSTMRSRSRGTVTSVRYASAAPPASRIRAAFASASPTSTSAMRTAAPSSASRRAVAPPMPLAPPVTMATRPCSSGILHSSPATPSAGAQALEDLARVRAEVQLAEHPVQVLGAHPRAPGDLALLVAHRSVPPHLVHGAPRLAAGSAVSVPEQEPELGPLHAQLLRHLPPRAVVVGLAGGADAAREDVVEAGVDVLGVRPPMDEDLAGRVADEDVRAAVQQVACAQLAARDRRHHVVVLVDDVHQLPGGVHVGTGRLGGSGRHRWGRGTSREPREVPGAVGRLRARCHAIRRRHEIGRASCRERGESGGGAGRMKRTT